MAWCPTRFVTLIAGLAHDRAGLHGETQLWEARVVLERCLSGHEYLSAVTELLRSWRRRDPTGGVWEAADLQWWWRRDQHNDPARAVFWFDGDQPVMASVVTEWGHDRFGFDVLSDGSRPWADTVALVRPRLAEQLAGIAGSAEMVVGEGDADLQALVTGEGFVPSDEVSVTTWMAAADRPAVPPLPAGFRLMARDDVADRPHHMAARNGPHVAARLVECPLYRSDLDLAVYDPDGGFAGYGLFWADPVTGVGLVEPMRTEDEFQGRGIGRCVLAEGLARLASVGCTRLKVTYIDGNETPRRLYVGAGFVPVGHASTYRR